MPDLRPFVTTTKDINLGQLAEEIGHALTSGPNPDGPGLTIKVALENTGATVEQLEGAVGAHVAVPVEKTLTDAEKIEDLTRRLAALASHVGAPEIADPLNNSDLLGG